MHYDSPPLACPVLFCSAPNLFPFHWQCPSFPPHSLSLLLLHSSDLFLPLWSRSNRGRGERRREKQECLIQFCAADTLGLSLPPLFLLLLLLWFEIVPAYSKKWQGVGSNSEVRSLTGVCVTHGLVAARCATGGAVRCSLTLTADAGDNCFVSSLFFQSLIKVCVSFMKQGIILLSALSFL